MASFVTCTEIDSGKTVLVNLDLVFMIEPSKGGGSWIRFSGTDATAAVKESPEQVTKLKAYYGA